MVRQGDWERLIEYFRSMSVQAVQAQTLVQVAMKSGLTQHQAGTMLDLLGDMENDIARAREVLATFERRSGSSVGMPPAVVGG